MSQNDFTIANQGFPAFRADLNSALQALASLSEGATEPSTTFAYQLWYDSTTDILKVRNADNDAWINLFNFDQATDTVSVEGADLVEDTTPQLGGNLDTNTKNIEFGDSSSATNNRLKLGAGPDLQIYHDGSDSFVNETGTGSLIIKGGSTVQIQASNGEVSLTANDNGAVSLNYDNATKLATTATGIDVTGTAVTDGLTVAGTSLVQQTKEKMTISATAATGTINYDALTQAVLYYTTDASANWTVNVRGDGSNTLNSIMSIGEALTVVFLVTQGSTAYYNSAFQVDGSSVTPKYQGGSAPTQGTASRIDAYTYNIIKTADATFTVLASLVDFS